MLLQAVLTRNIGDERKFTAQEYAEGVLKVEAYSTLVRARVFVELCGDDATLQNFQLFFNNKATSEIAFKLVTNEMDTGDDVIDDAGNWGTPPSVAAMGDAMLKYGMIKQVDGARIPANEHYMKQFQRHLEKKKQEAHLGKGKQTMGAVLQT